MAIESASGALIKFEDPEKHNVSVVAAEYFILKFKDKFMSLEKQMHSNWRTHKSFYESISSIMLTTHDKQQAKEYALLMCNTLKTKTCSQPVKRTITENLAKMLTTRPNYQIRQLIHKKMM